MAYKQNPKSPILKALVGNQHKLPQHLQDAIKAAPESPAKVKGKRDIKAEKASARRDDKMLEQRIARSEFLQASQNRTATNQATAGRKDKSAAAARRNAKQEVARTRHNLNVSNAGGESLKAGEYIMAPLAAKGKNVPKPKGAQLKPTPAKKYKK